MASPYHGLDRSAWAEKTKALVAAHPLKPEEIVDVVLGAWSAIFKSKIGPKGFRVGRDITPKPQIMGFFLHELIPLELAYRYPGRWSPERSGGDKDIVCLFDAGYSIE